MFYKNKAYNFQYENKTLHSNVSIRGGVHAYETFQERRALCLYRIVSYKHGQEPIRLPKLSQVFKYECCDLPCSYLIPYFKTYR